MAYTNAQFFAKIKDAVILDAKRSGILASLTAAQAFIESGSGNSGLTTKANALFGIKGTYKGKYVEMKTQEWSAGKGYYTVIAKFRAYPSWEASISDHTDFLLSNSRYKNLIGVKDYRTVCQLIQKDGYASDPKYANTLINTIEKFKLYEWDVANSKPKTPFTPYAGTITASWLMVRSGPGKNFPVVKNKEGDDFKIKQGICVAVLDEQDGWCCITPDRSCWVSQIYVKKG